jgi:hypothetical protein
MWKASGILEKKPANETAFRELIVGAPDLCRVARRQRFYEGMRRAGVPEG